MSSKDRVLSAAFWRGLASSGTTTPTSEIHEIDAWAEIAAFPGPGILFGAGDKVLAANDAASRLIRAMADGAGQEIRILVAGVAVTGRPAVGQIFLPAIPATGEAQALYYLTAMALSSANQSSDQRRVMILGRDASAEYAMRNALIESRDLYRDLSRCSSDFSWQTDENGAFTFVSAKGALGYSAKALNGRRSQDLLDQSTDSSDVNPFIARMPVENIEIAVRDAKGEIRYCRVDALPVYAKNNQWRGARGVSSDITEAKLHQRALEFMRRRETLVRAIVDATHRTLNPEDAFCDAADILLREAGAVHCAILTQDTTPRVRELGVSCPNISGLEIPDIIRLGLEGSADCAGNGDRQINFNEGGRQHQVVFTTHGGRRNGAIWLLFPENPIPPVIPHHAYPGAPVCSLAESVASHVGIAIAHDTQMRRLSELSCTDELTGLLNRRAFMEDLHHRHAHLYRSGHTGALLYIDLDNFKQVNDRFGHAAGDRVLKEFANILHGHSRIGDLSARLGGDEFAIWLEDTDVSGAVTKAKHLMAETKLLHTLAGDDADVEMPQLGLSIGISIADPGVREQLPHLIKRADEVMYEVKRQGKGGLMIARREPYEGVSLGK